MGKVWCKVSSRFNPAQTTKISLEHSTLATEKASLCYWDWDSVQGFTSWCWLVVDAPLTSIFRGCVVQLPKRFTTSRKSTCVYATKQFTANCTKSPQKIESLQKIYSNRSLYDLLSNKSTADRDSGVWALRVKEWWVMKVMAIKMMDCDNYVWNEMACKAGWLR